MAQNWTNASEYLRILPSRDPIDFETAVETFQTLAHPSPATASGHSQQTAAAASGEQCTYDCLITAIPTDKGTDLQYYFGVDSAFGLSALQPHLRNLFPDNYQLTTQTDVPLLADRPDLEWSHAVEAVGLPKCYSDWDTQLDSGRERVGIWPSLTTTLEALQATETPALVQICFRPTNKLKNRLEKREQQLKKGFLRPVTALFEEWVLGNTLDEKSKQEHRYKIRNRITHLENKIPEAYDVSLRVLIGAGTNAGATAHSLANTLTGLSGEYYAIDGTTHTDTDSVMEAIRNRRVVETEYRYAREKLPFTAPSSRGIVADASEIGSFCLVDGAELTEPAIRALGTQSDRSGIATPPPPRILEEYDNGFPLGHLRNSEGVVEETRISLPPKYQSRHTLITAATGGGKTVLTQNAILANQERTDGADILIEPKGGEMVSTLLRSYYARHGNLDDVYYFDCSETLPALSVLDIRPELAAGIPRESAVPNAIDHYIDILRALYGKEEYNQANRSRDVIRFLLKAQFDSVHGEDAFEHSHLKTAAIQMEAEQAPPAVSDPKLEQNLSGIVDEKTEMFSNIMGGVSSRLDAVSRDNRLRALFNHVPGSESERFDLATLLDEDALIILDMGHLKSSTQQAITQVVLANLWSALKRRARHTDRAPGADPPLVNLYLEEAATFAELDLLGELLDQSRSFGVGLTLVTQYPGQFKHANSATHERILNNVGTTVAGYIQHDRALAEAMATDKQSPEDVKRVLNS